MTKKEFNEKISYHKYSSRNKNSNVNAIFFDWVNTDEGCGFKYCIYARAIFATKKDLLNKLYDFISGNIEDIEEYYIQLVVAENDTQRFKVPFTGNGLTRLIK